MTSQGSEQSRQIGYDLYTHRGDRWMLEQSFTAKGLAIMEAKELEKGGFDVRIVKENLNLNSGKSLESVIYKSSDKPFTKDNIAPRREKARARAKIAPQSVRERMPPKPALAKPVEVPYLQTFMWGIAALVAASVAAAAVNEFLFYTETGQSASAAVIIIVALGVVIGIMNRPLSNLLAALDMAEVSVRKDVRSKHAPKARIPMDTPPPPQESVEAEVPEDEGKEAPAETTEVADADATDEPKDDKPKNDPGKVAARASMMAGVVGAAMRSLREIEAQLDAYMRFGVCLLVLAQVEDEKDACGIEAMQEVLGALGVDSDMSLMMWRQSKEYWEMPKYAEMMSRGLAIHKAAINGDAFEVDVKDAVTNWQRPKSTPVDGVWTMCFTDIVGSTDMTQRLGDDIAQEVVRAHNSIVRTALLRHNGKEVKHTGDGIMAAFPNADDAVKAVAEIQKDIVRRNSRSPDREFHVRIGLATGTPIQEDNDFFGGVVQLSARTCAAAGADEILVSKATMEACGNSTVFDYAGMRFFKGFEEEVEVYFVKWAEDAESDVQQSEGDENAAPADQAPWRGKLPPGPPAAQPITPSATAP